MIEISIIVPVYKTEHYLQRCIESILAQSFTDFELILVDDGSPDRCPQICDEWALKDNRIVVIHKTNGGVSSARNVGLNISRGKYAMFCDSDDYIHPQWCETFYNVAESYQKYLVVSNFISLKHNEHIIPTLLCEKPNETFVSYFELFKHSLSPYIFNKIYDKRILDNYNIRFDESLYLGEDELFNINYLSFCVGIIHLPVDLYFYRINPGGITNTHSNERFNSNLELFSERMKAIDRMDIGAFCDIYLYLFIKKLNNETLQCKKNGLIARMKSNHKMMNTDEFKYCVKHASGEKESPLFMKVVRMHNYYIFWLFLKLDALKRKIFNHRK